MCGSTTPHRLEVQRSKHSGTPPAHTNGEQEQLKHYTFHRVRTHGLALALIPCQVDVGQRDKKGIVEGDEDKGERNSSEE